MYEDSKTSSSHDKDVEEKESNSPPRGELKRGATADLEAEVAKKGKPTLPDDSEADADAIPKRHPRRKPSAES